jgi:26S proteasome regulatory subunit N11
VLTGTNYVDLEDVGQRLIEDNIVSVSRQMMDKEASMAKSTDGITNGHNNSTMDVDGEEEL